MFKVRYKLDKGETAKWHKFLVEEWDIVANRTHLVRSMSFPRVPLFSGSPFTKVKCFLDVVSQTHFAVDYRQEFKKQIEQGKTFKIIFY